VFGPTTRFMARPARTPRYNFNDLLDVSEVFSLAEGDMIPKPHHSK
jgi:hypothetical protein